MTSFPRRRTALVAALLVGAGASGALLGETGARLPTIATAFVGRELRVDARFAGGLPPEAAHRLRSGLATKVRWTIRLYVQRNAWWDGFKDERLYEVTATYRPISSDYAVERRLDEKLLETAVVPTFDEAAAALARVGALPAFLMGEHLVGKKLVVKTRCAYGAGVSLGVIPTTAETPWTESAVFHWPGERPRP